MTFEDLNDSIKRVSYDGPWAFMRLLQESQIIPARQSNVFRVTFTSLGRKSTWEITAESANNPFRDPIISSYRAPESL
jgi:type VI secretion system protein ImpL